MPPFIENLHQNQAQLPHLFSFIQEVRPSVQRFNKWLSRAHSLTAYECPMNRDAYLTGSTSLQHLSYKLHSCRAIPSLTVAGPAFRQPWLYAPLDNPQPYQTLLLKIMEDEAPLSTFFKLDASGYLSFKHSCHNIFFQTSPGVSFCFVLFF